MVTTYAEEEHHTGLVQPALSHCPLLGQGRSFHTGLESHGAEAALAAELKT